MNGRTAPDPPEGVDREVVEGPAEVLEVSVKLSMNFPVRPFMKLSESMPLFMRPSPSPRSPGSGHKY